MLVRLGTRVTPQAGVGLPYPELISSSIVFFLSHLGHSWDSGDGQAQHSPCSTRAAVPGRFIKAPARLKIHTINL